MANILALNQTISYISTIKSHSRYIDIPNASDICKLKQIIIPRKINIHRIIAMELEVNDMIIMNIPIVLLTDITLTADSKIIAIPKTFDIHLHLLCYSKIRFILVTDDIFSYTLCLKNTFLSQIDKNMQRETNTKYFPIETIKSNINGHRAIGWFIIANKFSNIRIDIDKYTILDYGMEVFNIAGIKKIRKLNNKYCKTYKNLPPELISIVNEFITDRYIYWIPISTDARMINIHTNVSIYIDNTIYRGKAWTKQNNLVIVSDGAMGIKYCN